MFDLAIRLLLYLATNRVSCEDSDQTARLRRLIRVFTGHTCSFVGNAVLKQLSVILATIKNKTNNINSFSAKFQATFVVCFFILTNYRLYICKVERLTVQQGRSRWDGSLSRLIWIYAVCKSQLLSPVAVKEIKQTQNLVLWNTVSEVAYIMQHIQTHIFPLVYGLCAVCHALFAFPLGVFGWLKTVIVAIPGYLLYYLSVLNHKHKYHHIPNATASMYASGKWHTCKNTYSFFLQPSTKRCISGIMCQRYKQANHCLRPNFTCSGWLLSQIIPSF